MLSICLSQLSPQFQVFAASEFELHNSKKVKRKGFYAKVFTITLTNKKQSELSPLSVCKGGTTDSIIQEVRYHFLEWSGRPASFLPKLISTVIMIKCLRSKTFCTNLVASLIDSRVARYQPIIWHQEGWTNSLRLSTCTAAAGTWLAPDLGHAAVLNKGIRACTCRVRHCHNVLLQIYVTCTYIHVGGTKSGDNSEDIGYTSLLALHCEGETNV